jgi:hypothetical protein
MAHFASPGYISVLFHWDNLDANVINRVFRFGLRNTNNVEITSANGIKYVGNAASNGTVYEWTYADGDDTMVLSQDGLDILEFTAPSGGFGSIRALTIKYRDDNTASESGTWHMFAEGDVAPVVDIVEGLTLKVLSLDIQIVSGDIDTV